MGVVRLIDVLNLIAKGELKEGTKVRWCKDEYTYNGDDELDNHEGCSSLWEDMYLGSLNEECELIEAIEESDKKVEKIEELIDWYSTANDSKSDKELMKILWKKLNEVIRVLNRRGE